MACEDLAREALEPIRVGDLVRVVANVAPNHPHQFPIGTVLPVLEFHEDGSGVDLGEWACRLDEVEKVPTHDAIGSGVKALEWNEITAARSDEDPSHEPTGDYEAVTGIGIYYVECGFGTDSYFFSVCLNGDHISSHDDPEEAKAAAQADFERRVLACLSAHTAAGAGPVGEAVAFRCQSSNPAHSPSDILVWNKETAEIHRRDGWTITPLYARPVEPGEVERLTRERDEAKALVDECCDARDGAGFLGSVPDCIEWLKDERAAAEAALAETRERLEKMEPARRAVQKLGGILSLKPHSREHDLSDRYLEWVQQVEKAHADIRDALDRAALTGDAQEAGK